MAQVHVMTPLGNEDAARRMVERLRWPHGAVCPRCGATKPYRIQANAAAKVRPGLYACRACRKQFTVTVGTIFEDSHIPLGKWLTAIHLLCASKKGMSAHQLHRMLGITYKSAWFMAHRIRYAMTQPPLVDKLRGIVEADETYVGGKPENRHKDQRVPGKPKVPVVSLVERAGRVRSQVVANVTAANLRKVIKDNVEPQSRLMTDGNLAYTMRVPEILTAPFPEILAGPDRL